MYGKNLKYFQKLFYKKQKGNTNKLISKMIKLLPSAQTQQFKLLMRNIKLNSEYQLLC